jgi:hypothetical protein
MECVDSFGSIVRKNIYLGGIYAEANEGGDALRDRDLDNGLALEKCCLLFVGDFDRDLKNRMKSLFLMKNQFINLDRFFCWDILFFDDAEDEDEDDDDDEEDDDEEDDDDDLDDEFVALFERLLSDCCRLSLLLNSFSSWSIGGFVTRRWGRSLENLCIFFVL